MFFICHSVSYQYALRGWVQAEYKVGGIAKELDVAQYESHVLGYLLRSTTHLCKTI